MHKAPAALIETARDVVEPLGYVLVGVEFLTGQPGGSLFRVYIDKDAGIQIDDCQRVSRQLSAVLDVEDPIREDYRLEVSSPGLDRPLFELGHFEQFIGEQVKLRLNGLIEGRKRYTGEILAVEGNDVLLLVDGERVLLPLEQIDRARLVPKF